MRDRITAGKNARIKVFATGGGSIAAATTAAAAFLQP